QLFDRLRKTRNSKDLVRQLRDGEPALAKLMRDELDLLWGPPAPPSAGSRMRTLVPVLVLVAAAWFGFLPRSSAPRPSPLPTSPAPNPVVRPNFENPLGDAMKALHEGKLDGHWGEATKRLLEGSPVQAMGKKWVLKGGFLEPDGWRKPADWTHPELEK